jgi:hypothetical protein
MSFSAPPRAAATRQLADLLLGLAGVMQRLRALPDGHPVIAASITGLERALETVLAGRGHLTVDVGTVQLLVDGMETNPDFEPLRDLATLLRDAGIGGIEFRPGVGSSELLAVFGAVASHNGGLHAWPLTAHIALRALAPSAPAGIDPWLLLERLAIAEPDRDMAARDPAELAFAIEMLPAEPARDARLLVYLAAMGRAAVVNPEDRVLLAQLLGTLSMARLRRLLAPWPGSPAQGAFLRAVAGQLPSGVLLRLLEAATEGRESQLSPAALQVLARVARRTSDPDHGMTRRALAGELARLVPVDPEADLAAQFPRLAPEPDRVLKLALESGILEPGILAAADRMIARRQVAPLLALLDTVPEEDHIARALHERVFNPGTVKVLLEASPVDLEVLDRLIPTAGIEAAPALLQGLAESRDRHVRFRLLDLLARYGDAIGPLAAERLEGMPWYVQRNVLALLSRLPDRPMRYTPAGVMTHRDPRVRHEAISLAIADPAHRLAGLTEALASGYERTLRLALITLATRCPPEFVPQVIARAADQSLDPELRALAVTAIASVNDPVVLRVLRRLVVARGITSLGRLAPKSATMLAALRGLATHWRNHPKVVPLLDTARQSRDEEIRAAARSPARRPSASLPWALS